MNRDYFARPIQAHGRSTHDYGNTRLGPRASPVAARLWVAAAGLALVALAVLL
jgi:hypothetical protein